MLTRFLLTYRLGSYVVDNREALLAELLRANDGEGLSVTFGIGCPKLQRLFDLLAEDRAFG